jgi:hypothetical protein
MTFAPVGRPDRRVESAEEVMGVRVLGHHDAPAADLAAAAEAAARSGFPAVALSGVGKRHGTGATAVDALVGVDLEVWPGELVVC